MAGNIVVITGAGGFIGLKCAEFFAASGYEVRALVRNVARAKQLLAETAAKIYKCELPNDIDQSAFDGDVRAVIHCAYETRFKDLKQAKEVNEDGTKKLLELTRKQGRGQFVFISSMAAHEGAESYYGRSKWQIERFLDLSKHSIIKPGTVLGTGGIFERTRVMMQKLPFLPVFFSSKNGKLQTVWIDDLCKGIFKVVDERLSGRFVIAEKDGVTMREFYKGIAALDGKNPVILPFPGQITLMALKVFEACGLNLPITSENLLGIKQLKHFDVESDLARLGLKARSFSESIKLLAINKIASKT